MKQVIIRGQVILLQRLYRKRHGVIMKNIAVLLTSVPRSGGEHQYLKMVMETLVDGNKRYFNVLAICSNSYWVAWCRAHHIRRVFYELEQYSQKKMKFNAHFKILSMIYNINYSKLGKIISDNKIDLLIGGQQSIFIPRVGCKIMQPVHDLMHRYEAHFEEISSTYEWRENYFSCSARISDVVLVDSQLGKRQYKECYYKKGKHMPKVKVLPFAALDYDKGEEYIETPVKYIFYPAQFWEHKNHKNLVLAVNLLKEKIPDIHLLLVGSDRNSGKKIKKIIKENILENNVSIKGFVSNEQIIYLYRHAVALVMPTYIGPTNIPPLEAMALGCPVIVSNRYAMPVQVGDAGLLCNPDSVKDIADCIEKVWNDEELRHNMIAKGYEQSQKWTASAFKKRFLKIVLDELNK